VGKRRREIYFSGSVGQTVCESVRAKRAGVSGSFLTSDEDPGRTAPESKKEKARKLLPTSASAAICQTSHRDGIAPSPTRAPGTRGYLFSLDCQLTVPGACGVVCVSSVVPFQCAALDASFLQTYSYISSFFQISTSPFPISVRSPGSHSDACDHALPLSRREIFVAATLHIDSFETKRIFAVSQRWSLQIAVGLKILRIYFPNGHHLGRADCTFGTRSVLGAFIPPIGYRPLSVPFTCPRTRHQRTHIHHPYSPPGVHGRVHAHSPRGYVPLPPSYSWRSRSFLLW
jgi:hypothetical protein